MGGVFLSLTLFMLRHHVRQFMEVLVLWTNKHLVDPQLLRRHRYLGPWSRAHVLLQFVYFAVIVFCLIYKVSSISTSALYLQVLW
jgi:hypothetical protein